MTDRFQVVVVGGGPVGVGLGVELAQRGVSCAVVERNAELQDIPKGQLLTGRTLEHFYFWHSLERLRASRLLPADHQIGTITTYESLGSDYWYGMSVAAPADADLYFQTGERLPQYQTERVLRERLSQLPAATAMFGMTATEVEQEGDAVRVVVAPTQEGARRFYSWESASEESAPLIGERRVLHADYVVGCDGARSLVRESAGINRTGRDYGKQMMLVVFRSSELHARLAGLPDATTYRVLRRELAGWWEFFGRIDLGERFFFHAPVPADADARTVDVQAVMHDAAGFAFDAQIDHVRFWEGRIMLATSYRNGRMFIAGDAAHQHPPYGAYGLNTGLEDAANLGWKLAATLDGWGGERLLDSYEAERRPVFADVADLIARGIDADGAFLARYDPERDRPEFERAWRELEHDESAFRLQREPCYDGSHVVCGPAQGRSGAVVPASHAARAGHHLSPRVLSSGENVFTRLGEGFTLIALDADATSVEAFGDAARSCRVPLEIIRDSLADDRAAYDARLILVRPDQYIAWSGLVAPDDPVEVLTRAAGTVTPSRTLIN
jgi:4-hydroxyisophthalate hydroxylase